VVPYDDGKFELVVNPQSLLYLFGMRLDYSDALIGACWTNQLAGCWPIESSLLLCSECAYHMM
jgi:hypothetical protein